MRRRRFERGTSKTSRTIDRYRPRLEGFGLLYPSPSARDLSQLPKAERPTKLVVLDGTWHHARAMYHYMDVLHGLPHYTLPAGLVSGFRIRKQPKSYCLS